MNNSVKDILCFGDSNTYGYKPDGSGRFDESTRWTRLVQDHLGENYHIIEEGMNGIKIWGDIMQVRVQKIEQTIERR